MLYLLTIFLSAFLLFLIQPMIAKIILPLFGGGATVWTICLLFFQGLLLLGYIYAHVLSKISKTRTQLIVHGSLLLLSLSVIPGEVSLNQFQHLSHTPTLGIMTILLTTIGAPYFILSATGPLVQRWFSLAHDKKLPYQLYSVSNIGSLLALLSYPFVIEPWLSLSLQGTVWTIGYGLLVLTFIILIYTLYQQHIGLTETHTKQHANKLPLKLSVRALWLGLSATGVVLLMSTTNAMTQNIPPVPFLWILPLSLYLLTFVISFHSPKWYVRWYWCAFFLLSAFAGILMFFIGSQFDLVSQVLVYSFILFSACMICHGELVKLSPSHDRLTQFYLLMALGGFLGSVFVSLIAEQLFVQFTEFPLALVFTLVLFACCVRADEQPLPTKPWIIYSGLATSLVTLLFMYTTLASLFNQHNVYAQRNFYGLIKVVDVEINGTTERRLIDGTTSHGTQSLLPEHALVPQSYYRKNTGVALALENLLPSSASPQPLNVGLIGLGAGTLAAYGRPQEFYQFYEINPAVAAVAQSHFSYLRDSKAVIDVAIGDGRQLLEQAYTEFGSQQFDVLVVDAFSGDAIPMHLLTQEAFTLYWQHLNSTGILALHISNTHLDLKALTRSLARQLNKQAIYVKTQSKVTGENDAEWVLITNNEQFLTNFTVKRHTTKWPESANKSLIWTDDYSNLLSVLK